MHERLLLGAGPNRHVTNAKLLLDSYEGFRLLDAAGRSALPVLAQRAAARFPLTRLF